MFVFTRSCKHLQTASASGEIELVFFLQVDPKACSSDQKATTIRCAHIPYQRASRLHYHAQLTTTCFVSMTGNEPCPIPRSLLDSDLRIIQVYLEFGLILD